MCVCVCECVQHAVERRYTATQAEGANKREFTLTEVCHVYKGDGISS